MSWRSSCGNRRSFGHPLVLSNYLEAQANLPYVDDSAAESPLSEDNIVGLTAHFLDAPAGGLASLTGLTSLNTLAADLYPPVSNHAAVAASHWMPITADRDDVISLMTGGMQSRSRQNSYCSHGSRWSYSSHVEQPFSNLRSASRLLDSSTGTRSCRNSLLASAPLQQQQQQPPVINNPYPESENSTNNDDASLSEDNVSCLWPPDYLVSEPEN